MSAEARKWAQRDSPMLKTTAGKNETVARTVLMAMAHYAQPKPEHNGDQIAYVSKATLRFDTGLAWEVIRRKLAILVEAGVIEPVGRTTSGVVRYRLRLDIVRPQSDYDEAEAEAENRLEQDRARKRRKGTSSTTESGGTSTTESCGTVGTSDAGSTTLGLDSTTFSPDSTTLGLDSTTQSPPMGIEGYEGEEEKEVPSAAAAPPGEIAVIDGEIVDAHEDGLFSVPPSTAAAKPTRTPKPKKPPMPAPRWDVEPFGIPGRPDGWTDEQLTAEIVRVWVDTCVLRGVTPSSSQIAQTGKETRGLIAAGNNPHFVRKAAHEAAQDANGPYSTIVNGCKRLYRDMSAAAGSPNVVRFDRRRSGPPTMSPNGSQIGPPDLNLISLLIQQGMWSRLLDDYGITQDQAPAWQHLSA